MQLIYASTPCGFDNPTLNKILVTARRNNMRNQVTCSLICRADFYLQMVGRLHSAVTATFHKILADDRHLEVFLIGCGDVKSRMFPNWYMRNDPAQSWMWTQDEIGNGAIEAASEEDVRAVFTKLLQVA